MSKKDYQAIARALYNVKRTAEPLDERTYFECQEAIADVLAADNPRFDGTRFDMACEPKGAK